MRIGLLTGLAAEAKAIGRADNITIETSAANRARAEARLQGLLEQGAEVLGSVGVAGGLHPGHAPGTILIARRVIAWEGALPNVKRKPVLKSAGQLIAASARPAGEQAQALTTTRPMWGADAEWVARIETALGPKVATADFLGLDQPVAEPGQKLALMEETGAEAADMESHIVARIAADAVVPWFAVRVVADPSNRRVPPAALAALGAEGDVSVARVLCALCRRPIDLPDLISLGADTAAAMRSLRRVGRKLREAVA